MVLSAGTGAQAQLPTTKILDCPAPKRQGVLRQEQKTVLGQLGNLTELRSQKDFDALAALGYTLLPHQFASVKGLGVEVSNPEGTLIAGNPTVLFYAPNPDAGDTTDTRGADYPYKLVGWGYAEPYIPDHLPSFFPCMGTQDWHVHERGIDALDTGETTPLPPAEPAFGAAPGLLSDAPALRPIVGFPHARGWEIHLWRDDSGLPRSAILDPTDPAPGLDPKEGSNYYFLDDPPKLALEPTATAFQQTVLQAGEGFPQGVAGGAYTLKVAAAQAKGAFSLLEGDLTPQASRPTEGKLDHDEGYYVLRGQINFKAGSQNLPARKGSFVYLPKGTDYSFKTGANGAKVLLLAVPGGLERDMGFKVPAPSKAVPPPAPPTTSLGSLSPYVLQPGEGEKVNIRGSVYTFKATAKDTGGHFTEMEIRFKRGAEPPPHIHHREQEVFYDLKGELTFQAVGQTFGATQGALCFLPNGLPHGYKVDGNGYANVVLIAVPAGIEGLFRLLSKFPAGQTPPVSESQKFGVEPIIPPGTPPPGS
jgi:quercetin dioxygenase-like cupin family protein